MKALCVPVFVVLTLVCAAVPLLSSVAIVVLICAPVYGQWVKVPAGGIPKGPDGKPNLSAPAPRSADGHPDLSAVVVVKRGNARGAKGAADKAENLTGCKFLYRQ